MEHRTQPVSLDLGLLIVDFDGAGLSPDVLYYNCYVSLMGGSIDGCLSDARPDPRVRPRPFDHR